jgi:hypothetical protein
VPAQARSQSSPTWRSPDGLESEYERRPDLIELAGSAATQRVFDLPQIDVRSERRKEKSGESDGRRTIGSHRVHRPVEAQVVDLRLRGGVDEDIGSPTKLLLR